MGRLGVGVYSDKRIEIGLTIDQLEQAKEIGSFYISLEDWRATNDKVESLAVSAGFHGAHGAIPNGS